MPDRPQEARSAASEREWKPGDGYPLPPIESELGTPLPEKLERTEPAAATTESRVAVVDSEQKANRPGDATNAPGHDTEEVTSMPEKPTTSCTHCFCRSKTVAVDALAIRKKRVSYCCWCGEEKS